MQSSLRAATGRGPNPRRYHAEPALGREMTTLRRPRGRPAVTPDHGRAVDPRSGGVTTTRPHASGDHRRRLPVAQIARSVRKNPLQHTVTITATSRRCATRPPAPSGRSARHHRTVAPIDDRAPPGGRECRHGIRCVRRRSRESHRHRPKRPAPPRSAGKPPLPAQPRLNGHPRPTIILY